MKRLIDKHLYRLIDESIAKKQNKQTNKCKKTVNDVT